MDFSDARDEWVEVATAGPRANNLHLTPDRSMPVPHHSSFYRLNALSAA